MPFASSNCASGVLLIGPCPGVVGSLPTRGDRPRVAILMVGERMTRTTASGGSPRFGSRLWRAPNLLTGPGNDVFYTLVIGYRQPLTVGLVSQFASNGSSWIDANGCAPKKGKDARLQT